MSPMRILIVEDDIESAQYLVKAFRESGHVADAARDGLEGYEMARDESYDVLIVDRMLPRMDGLSLIGGLRAQKVTTPVLILSALGQVDDRVKGLRAGGDDYLPKPYAYSELLARTEALARRKSNGNGEETVYKVGGLELDRLAHKLTRDGKEIVLQPREFRLLEYLMKHHGQVVTRTMLLENVWDYHFDPQTNVIDVHISRLRAKIDKGFRSAAPADGPEARDTRSVTALGKLFRTTAFQDLAGLSGHHLDRRGHRAAQRGLEHQGRGRPVGGADRRRRHGRSLRAICRRRRFPASPRSSTSASGSRAPDSTFSRRTPASRSSGNVLVRCRSASSTRRAWSRRPTR